MSIALSPGERLAKIVKSLKRSPNVSVGASKKGFGSSDRSKGCIVNTASLSHVPRVLREMLHLGGEPIRGPVPVRVADEFPFGRAHLPPNFLLTREKN